MVVQAIGYCSGYLQPHPKGKIDLEMEAGHNFNDMLKITAQQGNQMTKSDFRAKLNEASEIVESWPDWKKNSLKDSFKSRNTNPREEVTLKNDTQVDSSSNNKQAC